MNKIIRKMRFLLVLPPLLAVSTFASAQGEILIPGDQSISLLPEAPISTEMAEDIFKEKAITSAREELTSLLGNAEIFTEPPVKNDLKLVLEPVQASEANIQMNKKTDRSGTGEM